MTLEITYDAGDEEISLVLDDSAVLKAALGTKGELILNSKFMELEDESPEVYTALRKITRELFSLQNA